MGDHLLSQFIFPERLERLKNVAAQRTNNLTLVLDRVHHEHNISAVIRSADAFGIQQIHIIGSGGAFTSGIAMGAERWVEIKVHTDAKEAVADLKKSGFELVVTTSKKEGQELSVPVLSVYDVPFEKKLALIFGNELSGVADLFLTEAHYAAYIPMYGFVESLNVSVAAAIFLFCSTLSDISKKRRPETINSKEQEILVENWLKEDVRGSEFILKREREKK